MVLAFRYFLKPLHDLSEAEDPPRFHVTFVTFVTFGLSPAGARGAEPLG